MAPFWLPIALAVTGFLSLPGVYKRIAGLERGADGPEQGARLIQCLVCLACAGLALLTRDWAARTNRLGPVLVALLVVVWVELGARVTIRHVLPTVGRSWRFPRRLVDLVTEASERLGRYSWVDPHPFLQFTRPRVPLPGGDETFGFWHIKLSDVSKPPGVIRVACLGGSTTEDGYPERLQEYLDCASAPKRFQVLNFGIGWWSSLHTMLNFVLNVREFRPDFVVVHDNCNDDKYRGYPGIRGDCAHAYSVLNMPRDADEWFYRYSLWYRLIKIVEWRWQGPRAERPSLFIGEIGLRQGRRLRYNPRELLLFQRNIETICTLAAAEHIQVVLVTLPFSNVHKYADNHDRVYRPHMRQANALLREIARTRDVRLVDLDPLMTGREELFWDPVHVHPAGNEIKALCVGRAILSSLGIEPVADTRWLDVARRIE